MTDEQGDAIRSAYRWSTKARALDDEVQAIARLCEAQTGRPFDADALLAAVRRGESFEAVLARCTAERDDGPPRLDTGKGTPHE